VDATLDALKSYWADWGIRSNVGATEAELAAHESRYGLRFSSELRAYFRTVNGMADRVDSALDTDDDLIRFYPLAECRPLDIENPDTTVPGAARFLCFADYSIWGWGYGVWLGEGTGAGAVHVLYDADTVRVAETLQTFLQSYVRRDYAVTHPR
jgi:hypothetical protein